MWTEASFIWWPDCSRWPDWTTRFSHFGHVENLVVHLVTGSHLVAHQVAGASGRRSGCCRCVHLNYSGGQHCTFLCFFSEPSRLQLASELRREARRQRSTNIQADPPLVSLSCYCVLWRWMHLPWPNRWPNLYQVVLDTFSFCTNKMIVLLLWFIDIYSSQNQLCLKWRF